MPQPEMIDGVPVIPCVGCGYCCKKAICAEGYIAMGRPPLPMAEIECPYLYWNGEKYRCKLAATKSRALGIGLGCCMSLNTERKKYVEQDGTAS